MAKIVLSADAPDEAKTFSLANDTFEVPYETDDPTVLGNATSHPWLEVEYDAEASEARYRPTNVDPTKDPLSAENPESHLPFDEDAVAAIEAEKAEAVAAPLAIDAGEDQDEPRRLGGVDTTLAGFDPPNDDTFESDATDSQTTADVGDVS